MRSCLPSRVLMYLPCWWKPHWLSSLLNRWLGDARGHRGWAEFKSGGRGIVKRAFKHMCLRGSSCPWVWWGICPKPLLLRQGELHVGLLAVEVSVSSWSLLSWNGSSGPANPMVKLESITWVTGTPNPWILDYLTLGEQCWELSRETKSISGIHTSPWMPCAQYAFQSDMTHSSSVWTWPMGGQQS